MYAVRCIEKIRKGSKIIGYKISGDGKLAGLVRDVSPEELKNMIINKQVKCVNLKLTKDLRLIDAKENAYYDAHTKLEDSIYYICNTELIRCVKSRMKNPNSIATELRRYGRLETLVKAYEINLQVMLIVKVDKIELVDMNTNEEATPLDISKTLTREQVSNWIETFINRIDTSGRKRKQ